MRYNEYMDATELINSIVWMQKAYLQEQWNDKQRDLLSDGITANLTKLREMGYTSGQIQALYDETMAKSTDKYMTMCTRYQITEDGKSYDIVEKYGLVWESPNPTHRGDIAKRYLQERIERGGHIIVIGHYNEAERPFPIST